MTRAERLEAAMRQAYNAGACDAADLWGEEDGVAEAENARLREAAWALVRSLDGAMFMYRAREDEVTAASHALHVLLLAGAD